MATTRMKPRSSTAITQIAAKLDEAARRGEPVEQISAGESGPLSLDEAYRVQAESIARRVTRGERRSGVKMGLTSRAKAAQMGVAEPVYGRLTDAMLVADGGTIRHGAYCHPRVEPEIAFLLSSPIAGRVSPAEAMLHVAGIAPAMEIIDSRYRDFRFSLEDVVADNTSAAGYVLGPWSHPALDTGNLGMVLEIDGRPVQIGSSAAILGHPARSLAEAARFAAERGDTLKEGFVVLAGGATAAVALSPGASVKLSVEALGSVAFQVAD